MVSLKIESVQKAKIFECVRLDVPDLVVLHCEVVQLGGVAEETLLNLLDVIGVDVDFPHAIWQIPRDVDQAVLS